jgi:hypothetical protein
VVLLLSTGGGQRARQLSTPSTLSGNALIYTTVIKTLTVCYETLPLFPGKKAASSYNS